MLLILLHNVQYAPPRFGFDDPKEYVGLVGKTKEVSLGSIRRANLLRVNRMRTKASTLHLARPQKTIQNICRYIPELAEYPADHISFRLSSTASAHPRNWPVVTEDIWFTFVSDPPEKLGVIVEPTQKDKDASEFGSFVNSALERLERPYLTTLFWFDDLDRARQVKISIIIVCCFIGFLGLVAAIVAMGDHFFPS